MRTSVACLRERRSRLATLPFGANGRRDESREERMRSRGPGLELRMKLTSDEPRMRRILDDLDQLSVRTHAAQPQSMLDELVAVLVRHLVAVPMPLADLGNTVHFSHLRSARQPRRIRAEPHRAAHVGHVLL